MAYSFSNTLQSTKSATANTSYNPNKMSSYYSFSNTLQSSSINTATRYSTKSNTDIKISATDKRSVAAYRYTIALQYLNVAKNISTDIKNECVKSLIIDHNYEVNCMPIVYVNLKLDKSLVDDMIKNQNDNMIIFTLSKYNDSSEMKVNTMVFRKKFIYFLPDNVNKMDPVDYNNITNDQMKGDTYTSLTLGLLCLDHVNDNKTHCEVTAKEVTMSEIVKYITSHINNLIIEPFSYNDTFDQFVLPPHDSVNKALKYLNNQKVFYSTPYRYYQDFDCTYILSSSGRPTERKEDLYSSVILSIRDIDDDNANTIGVVTNKTAGTYEVYVNYANTQVYDNTLINKSKNKVKGITSSGSTETNLLNTASYSKNKTETIRLNNDNEHMMENIEARNNSENFLVYFSKNDLDTELFTINKRISIHNIDRYQEFNGSYILYRKREIFLREDQNFVMNSMINLKKLDSETSGVTVTSGSYNTVVRRNINTSNTTGSKGDSYYDFLNSINKRS